MSRKGTNCYILNFCYLLVQDGKICRNFLPKFYCKQYQQQSQVVPTKGMTWRPSEPIMELAMEDNKIALTNHVWIEIFKTIKQSIVDIKGNSCIVMVTNLLEERARTMPIGVSSENRRQLSKTNETVIISNLYLVFWGFSFFQNS